MTRILCPAELLLPPIAKPAPPAGAVLRGNQAGLDFVADLGGWGDDLAARLADAAAECPK